MERVKDPILHVVKAHSQLVNAIAQKVSLRPTKFVPLFSKALDPDEALQSNLKRLIAKPFQDRDTAVIIAVENNFGARHYP
jgi:hypothetical protein